MGRLPDSLLALVVGYWVFIDCGIGCFRNHNFSKAITHPLDFNQIYHKNTVFQKTPKIKRILDVTADDLARENQGLSAFFATVTIF